MVGAATGGVVGAATGGAQVGAVTGGIVGVGTVTGGVVGVGVGLSCLVCQQTLDPALFRMLTSMCEHT